MTKATQSPVQNRPVALSTFLHFQDGHSDKVYNVFLVAASGYIHNKNEVFDVTFEYGRRGSTLQTGTKSSSVDLIKATKMYNKIIGEKKAKGYQDISGFSTGHTLTSGPRKKDSGINLMLLNEIEEDEVEKYLEDDRYLMQEKMDGERRAILVTPNLVTGVNRKGQEVPLPNKLADDLQFTTFGFVDFVLDGEQIGDEYYAFDLLAANKSNQRYNACAFRLENLQTIIESGNYQFVHFVKPATTYAEKMKLIEKLRENDKEGVVFKFKEGAYIPGKHTGKNIAALMQLKFKFYDTASFIVIAQNDQRSVQIGVSLQNDTDKILPVGNVTIPVNFKVPNPDAIVEVRYLYAYRGGSVYQPVYLGERNDLSIDDCHIGQLKYKSNISLI